MIPAPIHRGVFRSWAGIDIAHRWWAQESHWRQLYGDQTDVLPQAEHDVQVRALRLHLLNGFGWWANTEYAGFTAVVTGERSKQVRTDHEFVTLSQKTQCPVHLISEKVQGNLPRCFHMRESRVKRHFPTESAFPQDIKQFREKGESFFRFSDPQEAARTVLEEQRDHQLAAANSEILKQECKLDSLNACIRELQRQAHSNRLELDCVNCGYKESRREQARLHQELAQREKALRGTRIRNIHEVEELKRA